MKFCKNLLRVIELSDPSWVPFWMEYKVLKKSIKTIPSVLPPSSPTSDASDDGNEIQPPNLRLDDNESPSIAGLGSQAGTTNTLNSATVSQKENVGTAIASSPDVLVKHPSEVMFFKFLHAELRKSIHFFERTSEEYRIRAIRLQEGTLILRKSTCALVDDKWLVMARAAFKVYRDLVLLETYAIMTYCGFSKILKKHDKMTGRNTRAAFMNSMVSRANFSDTSQLQELIQMSQLKYKEASLELEKAGRSNLQEDERLFINLIAQINEDVIVMADEEDTPMSTSRGKLSVDFFQVNQASSLDQTSIKRCIQEDDLQTDETERKRPKL